MSTELEDRIRRHYAERTLNEPLDDEAEPWVGRPARRRLRPAAALAAAAAMAVAVTLVVTDDDRGRTPVVTNEPTTTVAPSSSTTTTPTTVAPTTTTVATTTTTHLVATPTSETVVITGRGGGIAGWWNNGWVRWTTTTPVPLAGDEEFRIVYLGDPIVVTSDWTTTDNCTASGEGAPDLDIGAFAEFLGGVAITGSHDPRPRPVRVLNPEAEAYREAAREIVGNFGIDDPDPNVVQVVQADFDGNGTNEVVVVVERITNPDTMFAEEGDYSILFVRHVDGDGQVYDVPVEWWQADLVNHELPSISSIRVEALVDVNGDGGMELATSHHEWESGGTRVYATAVDGFTYEKVLERSCGL